MRLVGWQMVNSTNCGYVASHFVRRSSKWHNDLWRVRQLWTKQWQDLTHREAACWSAKDRSASAQKLKQFSMPVCSVMLAQDTTKQSGAKYFKSINSRLRFHLVKRSRYSNAVKCVYFWENVKVIRMKAVLAWKKVKRREIEGLRDCRYEKIWVAVWI